MLTEILKPCRETYIKCAEIIEKGGVVAFPTETVYGLGASAFDENAIKKIFEAKGRPSDNPLIIHVADKSDIEKAGYVTPLAEKIINVFMPGPVTVVLRKKAAICGAATANLDTAGIRIPSNEYARDFIRECGVPIAAPSANASGRPSPTQAAHVYEDLKGLIPAIIDGGTCEIGIESTVIDACGDIPVILRPGKISAEDIFKATGKTAIYGGEGKTVKSPGVKYRHYAPACPCFMVRNKSISFIERIYDRFDLKGQKPVLICYEDTAKALSGRNTVSLGASDDEAASALYGALRQAEKYAGVILLECRGENDKGCLYNRMIKSCGGNIIEE
jgi:L-threonylcarbamoyladenylate synthase